MKCRCCGYDMGEDAKDLRFCPKCLKSTELNDKCMKKFYAEEKTKQAAKYKKSLLHDYSDEELLALGLYPKDEGYKMSLISRILRK